MFWALFLTACDDGNTIGGDDTSGDGETIVAPKLVINEFLADNVEFMADAAGEFDDWVEIYNAGDTLVSLEGFYLTDDFEEPTKWALPTDRGIEPGEFLVVWCDKQPDQSGADEVHADFALEQKGEQIGLYYAVDGGEAWANKVRYGEQAADLSSARVPDGSATWEAGAVPTPGEPNE